VNLLLSAACLLALLVTSSRAAELTAEQTGVLDGKPFYAISLKGDITDDDPEKVRRLFDRLLIKDSYFKDSDPSSAIAIAYLSSQGGSWNAGVELAELFRERLVSTAVRGEDECYSACAIAFLGGHFRVDTMPVPSRNLSQHAKLGFHAPYLTLKEEQYARRDVNDAYAASLKAITTVLRENGVFGLSNDQIIRIFLTKPDDLVMVATASDLLEYNIGLLGVRSLRVTPSYEASVNICLNNYSALSRHEPAPISVFPEPTPSTSHANRRNAMSSWLSPSNTPPQPVTQFLVAFDGQTSFALYPKSVSACLVEFNSDTFGCRSFIAANTYDEVFKVVNQIEASQETMKNFVDCAIENRMNFDPTIIDHSRHDAFVGPNPIEAVDPSTPIDLIIDRLGELNAKGKHD
jgi:hypothetical protein